MTLCNNTVLRVGGSVCVWIVLFLSPVYAQSTRNSSHAIEPPDSIRSYAIGEVMVIARQHRFLVSSPTPAQVLSGRELEKLNILSVADVTRYFSGVQLKDYGGVGGIKTINVRSLGSAHTAVFYDGMSIGNAQNGQVDLGRYSLENIESIELYNGQKPSILQPARSLFSSSTLFMQTKMPRFAEGRTTSLTATFKTGSFGLTSPAVLYQQKLTSSASLTVNGEWVKAHGRYPYRYRKTNGYDTTAIRQNGDVQALRVEACLFYKLRGDGRATLRGYLYDSERGLPGAIVANRFKHGQRQWDRNFFVHGSLRTSFFKQHHLLANAKFSRDYIRYVDPEYITLNGALDNRYYQNEWYVSLVNQVAVCRWWEMSLATDCSINTLDANLDRFPYPTRYTYLGALSNRMTWERFEVQASLLGSYVDERVKYYRKGDNRRIFCPVVSASVQPFNSKSFRLRAFYKESFRMPTFNDLYYTYVGNSSLRPEYTTQYDVGATWLYDRNTGFLRSLSLQGDVYYNRIKDKIVAIPSSNLFRWTMMNLDEVEIKGLEANANFGFRLPANITFDLGLSYTYQKAIDITPEGTTNGHQIPYTPWHSGTVVASAQWKHIQLNYSFIYTGERYNQKANILNNYVQPWYTSDVALTGEGRVFMQSVKVGLELNNLFNQHYAVVHSFPMPGRNFRINFSINI